MRKPGRVARWMAAVAAALVVAACQADEAPDFGAQPPSSADGEDPAASADLPEVDPFSTTEVTLRDGDRRHVVPVYVADSWRLRQRGLMGWESLPEGAGMLFDFSRERQGGFWMKDTLIPLSIAFAGDDGEILAILDMEPCEQDPCPSYDPGTAYRYALEVEQGHFDELGVEPGWVLDSSGR